MNRLHLLGFPTRRTRTGQAGQGLAEYALILGLVAIVAVAGLIFLSDQINATLSYIGITL